MIVTVGLTTVLLVVLAGAELAAAGWVDEGAFEVESEERAVDIGVLTGAEDEGTEVFDGSGVLLLGATDVLDTAEVAGAVGTAEVTGAVEDSMDLLVSTALVAVPVVDTLAVGTAVVDSDAVIGTINGRVLFAVDEYDTV